MWLEGMVRSCTFEPCFIKLPLSVSILNGIIMKVKDVVFMCLDLAKASTSDDSYLNESHVVFLCKKYRAFLLKKEQDKEIG